MQKNIFLPIIILVIFIFSTPVFAETQTADYICDLGATYYKEGRYEEALVEFNDALALDPENITAKSYLNDIFKIQNPQPNEAVPQDSTVPDLTENKTVDNPVYPAPKEINREKAIDNAFGSVGGKNSNKDLKPLYKNVGKGIDAGPFKITGAMQLSVGATPDDFIWKRANFDLNEKFKSWRPTSNAGFNRTFNTYDPAIYDYLNVNVDTENKQGLNFHTNITVDPWSFTGKSSKFTVSGTKGEAVNLQMYYWSNTGYIVNHTFPTSLKGDTLDIPEIKVKNGVTDPFTATSSASKAVFNIPSVKIDRQFQPMRELWLDYANDTVKLRTFALGYQDQAYSSDDPMGITNHGIWWKDSKWLRMYTPGTFNSADTPVVSFVKGKWDDSLSFLSKDSNGKYLTGLRGFSFNFQPEEKTSFDTTVATPKHLWQDYGEVDNLISASRLKHYFADNFMLGGTFTSRFGFLTDQSNKLDSQNLVGGVDLGYEFIEGLKIQGEVLTSKSNYDMSNSTYKTDSQGNAYYFSFISRFPQKSIMDLKYGYDEISMAKDETYLIKSKVGWLRLSLLWF